MSPVRTDADLAERAGFEPALGDYPKHAFQACDLNRSSTSPWPRFYASRCLRIRSNVAHAITHYSDRPRFTLRSAAVVEFVHERRDEATNAESLSPMSIRFAPLTTNAASTGMAHRHPGAPPTIVSYLTPRRPAVSAKARNPASSSVRIRASGRCRAGAASMRSADRPRNRRASGPPRRSSRDARARRS